MPPNCKGICHRYEASPRYSAGNKNCRMCEIFVKWDGLRCPCCNNILSANPNSTRDRNRLKKVRGVKTI